MRPRVALLASLLMSLALSASACAAAPRSIAVRLQVPAANRTGVFSSPHTLRLPRGWTAEAWAVVGDARLEAWTSNGDLLVSQPSSGSITELVPQARRSQPPTQHTIISGLNLPQGMAFDHVGGREVLYVAETDEIDRYLWEGNHVGARTVLISNLPSGNDHTFKNIVVDRHHNIFFDVGSTSNASPPPPSNPPWASVMEYSPSGRRIRVWARGVRNGDGLSFAPDGSLWTAVNGRDDVAFPFHTPYGGQSDAYGQVIKAYVNNHPPDQIAKLTPGRNLGWPFCNPDPDRKPGSAGTTFDYANMPFDRDQQSNADGRALDCAKLKPLERGLPAHSAPLGFHFLEGSGVPRPWKAGAVVAVHGSWDRQLPRPPGVLWMRWDGTTRTLGRAMTLISGFQDSSGNRWGRPVDVVPGPDGALYVSDDTAGAVYRIVPR